jgi:hypothetical protein
MEPLILRAGTSLEDLAEVELEAGAAWTENSTSVANVREIPGTPGTFLVKAPMKAFAIGLNIGPSGSAEATASSTSSLTRATTSADNSPSTITAPSRSRAASTSARSSATWNRSMVTDFVAIFVMSQPSRRAADEESGRSPIPPRTPRRERERHR